MASCGGRILAPPISSRALPLARHCPHVSSMSVFTRSRNSPSQGRRQTRSLTVAMHRRDETKVSTGTSDQPARILSTVLALGATAVLTAAASVHAEAAAAAMGVEVGLDFQRSCAGCHSGGGNVLQPAATLSSEDLQKNGLETVDDIYNITYFGKNRMPGYGEKCTPRGQCTFGPRLSEEEIRSLAEFVKQQAEEGWAKLP